MRIVLTVITFFVTLFIGSAINLATTLNEYGRVSAFGSVIALFVAIAAARAVSNKLKA